MSKSVAAKPIEYRDLIKEVYIDPIRTVVVIDDEFPSLDGLIAKELNEVGAWNGKEADAVKVKEILQYCRQKDKPWLVDVHDGNNIPFKKDEIIAPYLIHSDLMILDFHLADDGGKAIKILKKLAENNHFNMVIVYTHGDSQAGGNIEKVVQDIALGLTYSDESLHFSAEKETDIRSQITDWEDGEILSRLSDEITEQSYLNYRANQKNDCNKLPEQPEFQRIQELIKSFAKNTGVEINDIFLWLLCEKQKIIQTKLSDINLGHVTTALPGSDVNWIRTDRLFVTVVSKRDKPDELPEKLLDALHEWCPEPHRLLMSQMRFLMDDRGVLAESEVLGNRYIQVGWLKELLDSNPQDQNQVINNTINRHWEALGDVLRKDIKNFAKRLVLNLTSQDAVALIKRYSDVNVKTESENIAKHINCYNSTKPVDGYYLTTGHILEVNGNAEKEYWICLSPACDLVPDRNKSGLAGRVEDSMPFTAVQLEKLEKPKDIKKALNEVTRNIFLFLEIDNEIYTFNFHPSSQLHASPVWEQLIAENQGKFETIGKKMQIWRPRRFHRKHMTMEKYAARVVAQLQYEYALNLLQRFGATMSRVGLDFSKQN